MYITKQTTTYIQTHKLLSLSVSNSLFLKSIFKCYMTGWGSRSLPLYTHKYEKYTYINFTYKKNTYTYNKYFLLLFMLVPIAVKIIIKLRNFLYFFTTNCLYNFCNAKTRRVTPTRFFQIHQPKLEVPPRFHTAWGTSLSHTTSGFKFKFSKIVII